MKNAVITDHKLDFESVVWERDPMWVRFRVGTCTGLWNSDPLFYNILAVENSVPGNGHLNDVFQWFEFSCKRDRKSLRLMEILNPTFKKHLIEKRGFKEFGGDLMKSHHEMNLTLSL